MVSKTILSRELFEKYNAIEREIKRINRKLDYYSQHPMSGIHGVVSGSRSDFPYSACHFVISGSDIKSDETRKQKIQNLMIRLQERKREYEKLQIEIDIAIEEIDDIEMRQVLQYKFIDRMTDYEIGNELGYERSTVSKKISDFFSE